MQNDCLPIGTILPYVGELNQIPEGWALCDGTNGTPDLTGRFLEGVTSDAGQFKEAGLPNITGNFNCDVYANGSGWGNGAFQYSFNFGWGDSGTGDGLGRYSFDASRCSAVYGRSNTVQPASYTVYYIMKIH